MLQGKCLGFFVFGLAVTLLTASTSFGALVDVNPAHGNEISVLDILQAVADDATLTIDGVQRIDDALDATFVDGITTVTYIASMWGGTSATEGTRKHVFGYTEDGGALSLLFDTSTSDPGAQVSPGLAAGGVLRFAADNNKYAEAWTDDVDNVAMLNGATDRVLVFDVTAFEDALLNLDGSPIATEDNGNVLYLMFFDTGRDGDYNDLVVLVEDNSGAGPGPNPPAPASGILLAMGAVAMLRRKINK